MTGVTQDIACLKKSKMRKRARSTLCKNNYSKISNCAAKHFY